MESARTPYHLTSPVSSNHERNEFLVVQLRRFLFLSILLTVGALYQITQLAIDLDVLATSVKWQAFVGVLSISVVLEVVLIIASWTTSLRSLFRILNHTKQFLYRFRLINLIVFVALSGVFPLLILGAYGQHLEGFLVRLFILWCIGLAGGIFLHAYNPDRALHEGLFLSIVLYAAVYRITIFIPWVSTFPFSLGYSEGSRYYFASLFFQERIYGLTGLGLPVLHPTRYILQSLPFLISGLPIWAHRFWQVFLWIFMTIAASYTLTNRLSIPDKFKRLAWLIWAFLFMFQAPVYYHLQVIVVIVLLVADSRKFTRTFIVILLTSIWAGISRINWFPVPGMLAATIYLLERKMDQSTSIWRYLLKPGLLIGAGTLVAMGSQAIYIMLSGNQSNWFASSLSSPLFWYRLLPSATYELGVLPAILIASTPMAILILSNLLRRQQRWHPIRLLGLGSILGVLFVGGLVVSTKIGGGDDLHNLDAFLVHLMLIGTYMLFNRFQPDQVEGEPIPVSSWRTLTLLIAVPILFVLGLGGPISFRDRAMADTALAELEEIVMEAKADGGEVLFISNRHLLTFHLIEGIELVPEYEKTFLMEMAMSDNQEYFDVFNRDLKSHRFNLIVVNPQHIKYKGRDYIFGEEDDAWVRYVSTSLLEHYQNRIVLNADGEHIAVMEPKP
jgi:hypothetical protein